ncbi:hypothetical protein EJ02DRAFT_114113 [Clathrospora elynae]|uniref:Uncharacterized protein n=1 Tax=Clathrospora elynae TaxID=706981 RepID=A0A6A5SU29_9PLEO|nr:hypothetical protein EJ02DRAFT_114113 [Clathrospora elynae]
MMHRHAPRSIIPLRMHSDLRFLFSFAEMGLSGIWQALFMCMLLSPVYCCGGVWLYCLQRKLDAWMWLI